MFTTYTKEFPKTEDKLTELFLIKVTDTLLNLGEPVEPSQEFQESVDQVLTDLVKPLSVTCVEKVECLPHYTFGEDGTEK